MGALLFKARDIRSNFFIYQQNVELIGIVHVLIDEQNTYVNKQEKHVCLTYSKVICVLALNNFLQSGIEAYLIF